MEDMDSEMMQSVQQHAVVTLLRRVGAAGELKCTMSLVSYLDYYLFVQHNIQFPTFCCFMNW